MVHGPCPYVCGTCRMLKKEIQNVHELVHAHRLSVVAQGDACLYKKAKDFQRNESRERQSDFLFVSFSR